MAAKDLYSEKKKEKNPYGTYSTAIPRTQSTLKNSGWDAGQSTARMQSVPQSDAVQKPKREKSPSELGEEVVRIMLEDFKEEERQKQAAADRKAQYGSGTAKARAANENRKTAQYFNTAGQFGGQSSYSSPSAAKPAAGNQKATPYGGAATVQYNRPAAAEPAVRKCEKTPSELGDAVVARVLVDEGIMDPKDLEEYLASFEEPSSRTFTDTGGGNIMGRGANKLYSMQHSNRPVSPVQMFGGNTGPIDLPPAWQLPAAEQYLTTIGVDGDDLGGSQDGGSLYGLNENASSNPVPVPTFEEVMSAAAQDLAAAGINPDTMQFGYWLGDKVNQLIEDTHLAPGTSFADYIWDEIKSGAWSGAEGFRNGIVDLSELQEKGWLLTQNAEAQQQALFNEAYREQAERNNMQTQEVLDELPEYAESFRSHQAAEYAQQIDELYDAGGLFKICGDVASGIGQMAPTIAVNIATGGIGGMVYLYASAAGNAAAEARANGADDDTAFLYGMLSGSIEVLTEQIGGGIPGLNKGVLDDWLMGMAKSNTGRAALKHLANALGEGAEEFISEIAGAYLAQIWSDEEPDFWQTLGDAFYAGLIGTLTSACMSVPGNLAELNNARTVDTATAAMRNGEVLSGAQLANADSAMQKLIGPEGSDSPWSRIPAREWKDTKGSYFDSYFPQMAELTGKEADLSGIDLSKVIMLPMVKDTAAQANLTADPSTASTPAASNMAATQNGQPDLSNVIMLPTGSELEALVRADAEANAASVPATVGNTAMAQNGQPDLSDIIFPPTRDQLERWAKEDAQVNAASAPAANNAEAAQSNQLDRSNIIHFPTREELEARARADTEVNADLSPAANNNAAAQNSQPDLSNVFFFPTREQLERWAKEDAEASAASAPAADNNAAVQNDWLDLSNVSMLSTKSELETWTRADAEANAASVTAANDMSTELSTQKVAETNTLQTDPTADMASPEMIAEQNAMSVEEKKDVANAAVQEYNENKVGKRVETIDGVKHYYDDNGNLYRVKNDLQPNCEYELNGYKYQTDDIRRIRFAEGILHLKERVGRLPIRDSIEDIGKGNQREGDNRGHLIGDQFDGANGLENMVPQDAEINQKDFRNFENKLAAGIKDGKEVYVKVEPIYEGNSRRPSSIEVTYRINGVEDTMSFLNGKE